MNSTIRARHCAGGSNRMSVFNNSVCRAVDAARMRFMFAA